jgi:hypothetical protein
MKINKSNIIMLMFFFVTGLFILNACEEEKEYPRTRLFQPVLNNDEGLMSVENTIIVELGKMKAAEEYFVEVSRDSFVTVDYSFTTDTNYFVIDETLTNEELLWFTIYQIQVTAIADDEEYNSKPSFLGSVRTQKFPSNQRVPGVFDVTDTRAKVLWTPVGKPITGIKVYAIDDERLTSPLSEFEVTEEDRAAEEKIVGGLEPATEYQIAIYSDGELRGWEIYTTKPALELGDNVIDLTGTDNPDTLAAALADAPDGAYILLEGGKTYNAGGFEFSKSAHFVSGYSFVQSLPIIECGSNFRTPAGASISAITFENIRFQGDFGGNYVFNIDESSNIDEISFESCHIHSLRGICRMKGGEGHLGLYKLNNCVVDSINGYGVLTVDKDTWSVGDIVLSNSTFSKIQYFLVSRSNSNSITIDGCTLNEVPDVGRQMFRWRGDEGNNDVLNGIKIHNTIWGHGWDMDNEETYAVKGFDGLPNTNFDIKNTYATSDFEFSDSEIPAFPSFLYSGTAAQLWVDPYVALDFNINDNAFQGKSDSGDPRWRSGL